MHQIDSARLDEIVRSNIETLCRHFFPVGQREGREWKIANVTGSKGNSLGIQLTGPKAGVWHDRATDQGGRFAELLMLNRGITFPEAVELIERALGVSLRQTPEPFGNSQWQECVKRMNPAKRKALCVYRGYSAEIVDWLAERSLIGIFKDKHGIDRWAFPVQREGQVVAIHCEIQKDEKGRKHWFYLPKLSDLGLKMAPFVLGELSSATEVHIHESQWDLLAHADVIGFDTESQGIGLVATLGAANGALAGVVNSLEAKTYLWPQRDIADRNGKIPANEWLRAVRATLRRAARVCWIPDLTPDHDFDFNDWCRSRTICSDDLEQIMGGAELFEPPAPEKKITPFVPSLESDYGATNQSGDRPKGDAKAPDQDNDQEPRKFPLWCLPPVLRDMAKAISDSVRVPLELAGPIVLGIISGALGKGLKLKSGADRMVRGNLYLLGIAESGTGKSSACELAAEPIQAAEKEALGFWKEISKPEVKAEIRILEREIKALENQLSGKKNGVIDRSKLKKELTDKIAKLEYWQQKLEAPRMIVEDVTQEALGSLLARNSEQLFSLSADAGKTIQNLEGRYIKEKGKSDDGIYVKAYTGDRCLVDRIGRDSVILENPWLALLWLIQPERAQRLLANQDLRNGGFLPRCLIWDSLAEPTEEPEEIKPIPPEVRAKFSDLVGQLLRVYRDGKDYMVPASSVAREVIRKYHNRLVKRRRRNLYDINSFVARWHEQAWRILVVLHAGANGEKAHLTEIEDSRPDAAIQLAEWFGAEQVRLLSAARDTADRESLDRLLELVSRDYKGKATLRDLERRHCYRKQELERLAEKFPLKLAIRHGEPGPKGGRPSEVLQVLQVLSVSRY